MLIAIDGPSASGKGTIAKALARHFGFHYLDTGSLYRMVGLSAHRRGVSFADEDACAALAASLDPNSFDDHELRGETVASYASKVAVLAKVRAALLDLQRNFAARPPGAVLDGRDIGTVVCPRADFKFYITASAEARAQRRFLEAPGSQYPEVLADIQARDARDNGRRVAPAQKAPDAIAVDTTNLSVEQALAQVLAYMSQDGALIKSAKMAKNLET